MKKIKLSQGKFAIVDNEDYIKLNKITWYYDYRKYGGYAKHSDKKNNTSIYMHRIILNSKNDKFVDHINGNTLDNRKINLRICTPQQSVMNRGKQINNSSGYKGVYESKDQPRNKKWVAQIRLNRKTIFIGLFLTKIEAAKAYDKKAKELFGEFAKLNNI